MRLARVSWIVLGAALCATPALAQAREACLHLGRESPIEAQRREEALSATHLIDRALLQRPSRTTPYLTWEELAASPVIPRFRGMGGPLGEVAQKMRWGGREPLPGWEIHYIAANDRYAFSLTDTRDPCGFSYSSTETGVIREGYPVGSPRRGGIVPIT